MKAREISCPQCGSPISLWDIRKSGSTAKCDSCGVTADLSEHLAVAQRKRVVVVRTVKRNYGAVAIVLWLLVVVWFVGLFFFSPLKWLNEKELLLVMAFALYIAVGLTGVLLAVWVTLRTGRKLF